MGKVIPFKKKDNNIKFVNQVIQNESGLLLMVHTITYLNVGRITNGGWGILVWFNGSENCDEEGNPTEPYNLFIPCKDKKSAEFELQNMIDSIQQSQI